MDHLYQTFWHRLGAGFIDGLVLTGVGTLIYLFIPYPSGHINFLTVVADNSLYLAYSIYLHGRFGQTLGKKALKIHITDTEGRAISFSKATLRDLVYILFFAASLITLQTHAEDYARYNEGMEAISSYDPAAYEPNSEEMDEQVAKMSQIHSGPIVFLSYTAMIYLLIEIITMLSNKKRRALHDFIAGTEVRRLS